MMLVKDAYGNISIGALNLFIGLVKLYLANKLGAEIEATSSPDQSSIIFKNHNVSLCGIGIVKKYSDPDSQEEVIVFEVFEGLDLEIELEIYRMASDRFWIRKAR